jgi:nucleoside-diphosphate-sugar epimerase
LQINIYKKMANSVFPKVLIVGYGDLGSEVARQLAHDGIKAIGVRRSVHSIPDCANSHDVTVISADVTQPLSIAILASIEPEVIVYCVAASGQTDAEYKAAYVDGLRNVLATQQHNPQLKHVLFVSSTRVYGQDTDRLLDESIAAVPADFGGERLLEAEQLLQTLSCGATVLRLSGIYGPGRLRMLNLAKSPDNWPRQNIWSNRIHRDDAAAFIVFLIKQVLAGNHVLGCYIVTDSRPVPQYEVLEWLAEQMQTEKAKALSASGGKRLNNKSLLASGFKLQYPDYQAGYKKLL